MHVTDVPACTGCPLYGDGSSTFTPDVGNGTDVVIVTSPGVVVPTLTGVGVTVARVPRCGAAVKGKVGSYGLRFCLQAHPVTGQVVVALGQEAVTGLGVRGRIRDLRGLALDVGALRGDRIDGNKGLDSGRASGDTDIVTGELTALRDRQQHGALGDEPGAFVSSPLLPSKRSRRRPS